MQKKDKKEALRRIAEGLRSQGKSLRHISRTLGIHRSTLKKLLGLPTAKTLRKKQKALRSKLDPYRERIKQLAEKEELTNLKILEILRGEGYTGGKTILADFLRKERGSRKARKAFARYEPPPALEAQMDWSSWKVNINGKKTKIHIFSMILSYSRYQYLEVFLDEKQDTLIQGHIEAFEYFEGVPAVILYDRQSPIVAGTLSRGIPVIHQRFEAFSNHYGSRIKLCLPYDKERKGRIERVFGYLNTSFFPCRSFSSLDDLRRQLRAWLEDEQGKTGNFRIHGTTGRRPVDMWMEEKDLLIELPKTDFLPTRIEERLVGKDCLISVLGNQYTVPPRYVGRTVTVLISPKGIKAYNQKRELIASHDIPEGKGKMVIDENHYAQIRRTKEYVPSGNLEEFFLATFPEHSDFLDGLKRRVKSIYPIHLRHIRKLLEHFTTQQVEAALREATAHGRFIATYVAEILKRRYPHQMGLCRFDEELSKPKGLQLGPLELGDVDAFDRIFNDDDTQQEK